MSEAEKKELVDRIAEVVKSNPCSAGHAFMQGHFCVFCTKCGQCLPVDQRRPMGFTTEAPK